MYRQTGGGAGAATAAVSDLTALGAVIGPASGCAGSTRWAARGFTASPTSAQHVVASRTPVRASARPSVGEDMIPERAGCGKSARPVRRAATGNGVGLNRVVPARHRASRRLYPRAAMIAEDFCCMRVLASSKHSHAYGGASMCAHTAKRPARARPAQFVPATTFADLEAIEKKQTTFENPISGLVQYAG